MFKKNIIARIDNIDAIRPIFREYLNYISQFLDIKDQQAWCASALENLRKYSLEDRYIYILKRSGAIIGFALVSKHLRFNTDGFGIAEFYIQKKYEGRGYGRKLAESIFAQFPGNWEVAVSLKNNSAQKFWEQVVSSYTSGKFMKKKTRSFSGYGFVFNNALSYV
ncbi:MAG: GNAT family N-acetyltransferase [Candidatus Omnitrophota bacterium]